MLNQRSILDIYSLAGDWKGGYQKTLTIRTGAMNGATTRISSKHILATPVNQNEQRTQLDRFEDVLPIET